MSDMIEVIDQDTLVETDEVTTLISELRQGPQGIKGEPGAPGGTLISRTASQDLSGHRAVLIDATGNADYASAGQSTHAARVVGITVGAVATGADASIQIFGDLVEPTWSWTADQPIYLGINGALTQVPPTQPTSKFSQVLGFPILATSMFVNVQPPIAII